MTTIDSDTVVLTTFHGDFARNWANVGTFGEDPQIPEFTSKLAAVLAGASAIGLFGLIVLFRGRKKSGAKKKRKK